MAENIEFIAASDLPTTDAKEVDVLCVENGELKRKTGSLGGGGYVITIPIEVFEAAGESTEFTVEESYDNFADLLYNCGSVQVDISSYASVVVAPDTTMRIIPSMWTYMSGVIMIALVFMGDQMQFTFPNGTWTPPTA